MENEVDGNNEGDFVGTCDIDEGVVLRESDEAVGSNVGSVVCRILVGNCDGGLVGDGRTVGVESRWWLPVVVGVLVVGLVVGLRSMLLSIPLEGALADPFMANAAEIVTVTKTMSIIRASINTTAVLVPLVYMKARSESSVTASRERPVSRSIRLEAFDATLVSSL